jgi:nicotinamidase-related amidase
LTPGSPRFIEGHETAIANMKRLASAVAQCGDLLIYVRHVHRNDGSDAGRMFDYLGSSSEIGFVEGSDHVLFDPRLMLLPDALQVIKSRYWAFVGTNLHDTLRERKVDRIVVTGFISNFAARLRPVTPMTWTTSSTSQSTPQDARMLHTRSGSH